MYIFNPIFSEWTRPCVDVHLLLIIELDDVIEVCLPPAFLHTDWPALWIFKTVYN
jgi:hypothetical protein